MKKEEKQIYPKNKEHFKKLIPFAQKVISVCREVGIDPVIYGSFAHFYHTKDKNMNVNDIDMVIPKSSFKKCIKSLEKNKIKHEYVPEHSTIILKKGNLRVEIDDVSPGRKTISDEKLSKNIFKRIDFYGIKARIVTLKQLEEMYSYAYNHSRDSKAEILKKIKRLEKSLGRKIKKDIEVEIIKNKDLSKKQKETIKKARKKEFGNDEEKDFSKDYEPNTLWFFVKRKERIVSFGGIRPIKAKHLGKTYNIGGICSTISLEKGKGYGKILVSFMIDYSLRTGKSLLGFTGKTKFFKKADMGTKKDFIKRFVYVNPKTGEKTYDDDGNGIFYNGKDNFIKKVLSTKSPVYINVMHW